MTNKKKVTFNEHVSIYHYDYVELRYNINWIQIAVDSIRFQNRINRLSVILEPVLIRKVNEIKQRQ
jgi:hypothetical protein